MKVAQELYSEWFHALGMTCRIIQRNWEMFSADIVSSVYNGRMKHKLLFSGLNTKFLTVYGMGYTTGASGSHLTLKQFISDNGIL